MLRETTLVEVKLRTNYDHRTARVVNALTKQVLAEVPLLTLEVVRERLQRSALRLAHG